MEIKASATYLRISPRKLRLLTSGIRGMAPKKVLEKIEGYPQKGKEYLQKVIKQAVANAVNNFKLSEDSLVVEKVEVNEGPRFKRQDFSHGARFDRGIIAKKTSHLSVVLSSKEEMTLTEASKVKPVKKAVEKEIKTATKEKKPSVKTRITKQK